MDHSSLHKEIKGVEQWIRKKEGGCFVDKNHYW